MTKPAYLVRGDDPSLLADAARRVVDDLVGPHDHGLVVESFDAAELESSAPVVDACLTPPFLTELRVVLVRNVGAWAAEDADRVAAYLSEPLDTTRLVLVAGGGTTSRKMLDAVKKAGEVVDAGPPKGPAKQRTSWLVAQLADGPLNFDAKAGRALEAHLGEDVGRLPGIVATLVGAYGEGARIGVAELEPYLGEAGGVEPWHLTDAIDRGEYDTALTLLHRTLAGRHAMVVLAILHNHYGALLRVDGSGVRSEQEAATVLGITGRSTFRARKAMDQARSLGSERILRAVRLVADADVDLRGGRAWPDDLILEVLIARLCQLARRR